MRRVIALVSVLAFLVAACASSGGAGTAVTAEEPSTTGLQSAGTVADQTTTTQAPATETTSGRPVAPDFTLELGDGGSYTLSEGAKPVYLVFWAEW
ncbi:MAG: hypothetical protein WCE80_06850 [Acidimicrobiia bacterium]